MQLTFLAGAVLLLARCGFALMFLVSARDKFRLDRQEVALIRSLGLPVPEALERITGVFEVICAAALLVGFCASVAAGLLAAFTLFLTFAFLHFWTIRDAPQIRTAMRNTFVGNLAVTGGLLYVAVFGPGDLAVTYLLG